MGKLDGIIISTYLAVGTLGGIGVADLIEYKGYKNYLRSVMQDNHYTSKEKEILANQIKENYDSSGGKGNRFLWGILGFSMGLGAAMAHGEKGSEKVNDRDKEDKSCPQGRDPFSGMPY